MTNEKEKLIERIELRVSRQEKNLIKMLAQLYAGGNVSAYIVDRVINTNRKFINQSNFELSERRVMKKGDEKQPSPPKQTNENNGKLN